MYRRFLVVAGLVTGMCLAAVPAGSDTIDWNQVLGAKRSQLKPTEEERVAGLLARLKNTHGCKGTLAACLAASDQTARRHAGYVMRMVRKGKSDQQIEQGIRDRHLSAHPTETYAIDLSDHPRNGTESAKVVLVEYACFQCPYCAHLAPYLETLPDMFRGKVAHVYKFFPVRSHPRGVPAALAGLAAFRQGKFWELYRILFKNRSDLSDEALLSYASKAGLDLSKYQTAIQDPAAMKYIEKDKLEGMRNGVDGTPTFFVNGKLYLGQADFDEIVDRVGEELDIVEKRIP